MGYDLHIIRRTDWEDDEEDSNISLDEWLAYAGTDHELELTNGYEMSIPGNASYFHPVPGFCIWRGHSVPDLKKKPWLSYGHGSISTKYPDDETIGKMLAIAGELNARVQGDEGEFYDESYFNKPQKPAASGSATPLPDTSVTKKPWWKLWLLLLVCCANCQVPITTEIEPLQADADTSKPVITTSFSGRTFPSIFEAAFQPDTKVAYATISYTFHRLYIGQLKIESGKLIACDPIVMQDVSPFTQQFPLGSFPVHLAMAKTTDDERVAFSRILFSDKPVTRWEFALKPGQKPISLKDTSSYCYGVDAGMGVFIDSLANGVFALKDHAAWENVFLKKSEQSGYKGFVHEFEGHSLASFSTGYGDGCYSTYIGFDEQDNVCQLLTDFGMVEWWRL